MCLSHVLLSLSCKGLTLGAKAYAMSTRAVAPAQRHTVSHAGLGLGSGVWGHVFPFFFFSFHSFLSFPGSGVCGLGFGVWSLGWRSGVWDLGY